MRLFIVMVFVIYGGAHGYAFLRARNALGFGAGTAAALAVFMLVMTLAVFLIRALEHYEYEASARALAYVAYFWMAALFLFVCASLTLDVLSVVIRAAGGIARSGVSPFLPSSRTSFFISLAAAVSICLYGYFEAKDLCVERLTIETDKLPAAVDRLTIAQISDVHLGLIVRNSRLGPMLEAVESAKPDVFIVSGDLVDAQINSNNGLSDMLRRVSARYGKFAVMGNHEYYAGPERARAFFKASGLTLLRNETAEAGPITIVGADDRTGVQMDLRKPVSDQELLAGLPRKKFILFVKHQPRTDPEAVGLFDLQLSGHTHKGQIFPFNFVTRLTFPKNAGAYDLGGGSLLHVSRGTGTWGPPIRFLAPPEVTVVELVRKKML
jgi:uncharacterized protein